MATQISRTLVVLAIAAGALPAWAQSFRVQCPVATALHPGVCSGGSNAGAQCASSADCPGNATSAGSCTWNPASNADGQIKCQHIGGGDGYATMGDGHQIYLFAFSPLSGLRSIEAGLPGTQTADVFNAGYHGPNYSTLGSGAGNAAATPDDGAVTEPAGIMDMGVLAGNAPAPLMAIDEDDEFFLTLSNPGMIMRPDLFEQHTVHFHGYPNASSYFDGVPDASIAINIAGSFTYYYTAPDAGTYFWHCHITPPEHLEMGMVGQLYVRPRQNRVTRSSSASSAALLAALVAGNKRTPGANGTTCSDILCTGQTPVPAVAPATPVTFPQGQKFAYNDGDGSTAYDVEVPIQMMGFDPNFHYVGMTFNPESFFDMKDKYPLLNGRGYPDTVNASAISTMSADGTSRPAQPIPALIVIDKTGGKTRALVRLSMLSVTEHVTIGTIGVPMHVIAQNARLLRDMAGGDTTYFANSITLGGGESADFILDVSDPQYAAGQTFYLYSTNLDHLSNDAENFGGMMTEIRIQ